jgi:integrase
LERQLLLGSALQNNDIVFASATGTFLDPTNVHHRFERALVAAGLPILPLHALRHTAATLALQQGIHPKIVQDMLGHSTYTLTMNTYSHVTPALHREAMRTMSRIFDESVGHRSENDA